LARNVPRCPPLNEALLPSISWQPPIGVSLHAAALRTFAIREIARVNNTRCVNIADQRRARFDGRNIR